MFPGAQAPAPTTAAPPTSTADNITKMDFQKDSVSTQIKIESGINSPPSQYSPFRQKSSAPIGQQDVIGGEPQVIVESTDDGRYGDQEMVLQSSLCNETEMGDQREAL